MGIDQGYTKSNFDRWRFIGDGGRTTPALKLTMTKEAIQRLQLILDWLAGASDVQLEATSDMTVCFVVISCQRPPPEASLLEAGNGWKSLTEAVEEAVVG